MSKADNQTAFKFNSFYIIESHINFDKIKEKSDLEVEINPVGRYFEDSQIYELTLVVKVDDRITNSQIVALKSESRFSFKGDFDEIPDFFTLNAPALSFPYIRSYISALSSLSGLNLITLPILNLISLKEELKQNFERVKSMSSE